MNSISKSIPISIFLYLIKNWINSSIELNHHNLFWIWIFNLQYIGNMEDDIDNKDTLSPACATRQCFMMIMVMKKMVMWSCGRGWQSSRKIANLEDIVFRMHIEWCAELVYIVDEIYENIDENCKLKEINGDAHRVGVSGVPSWYRL